MKFQNSENSEYCIQFIIVSATLKALALHQVKGATHIDPTIQHVARVRKHMAYSRYDHFTNDPAFKFREVTR